MLCVDYSQVKREILYPLFIVCSDSEIKVSVRDAISNDMDSKANVALLQKLGSLLEVAKGIRAFSVFHK